MPTSAVEIAKKQRHIHLLEKVKDNKALTAAEMRELDGYESEHKANPPVIPNQKSEIINRKSGRRNQSLQAVREAGFECPDLAAAGERLGVADLSAILDSSKRLSAAWERGRLLRRIREVASETMVVPEAVDKLLGLPRGTFAPLLARDRTIREIWHGGRDVIMLASEKALVARVKEGDPKAVAAVEHLFGHRAEPAAEIDVQRLRPSRMEAATGIKREQWDRWGRENGCPRNMDGSYSLARIIAWLRRWERDKANGGREAAGLNPLQSEKARREKRENDEAEGREIPIAIHVEELKRRAYCVYGLISPFRAKEWAQSFSGKDEAEREQEIRAAFGVVLGAYRTLSPDIPMPEEARVKIEEGLAMLMKPQTDKG